MTDFDDARKLGDPSYAIKERFYQTYFSPLLKKAPQRSSYVYLLHQAWSGWRHHVNNDDMKNVQFVEWMCEELYKSNPDDLALLISEILDKSGDAVVRIKESERNYFEAKDVVSKFTNAVRHYKVFFESELRLWSSVPYFYICKNMGIKHSGSTPKSFVGIAAGEKYQAIKNVTLILPKGKISDLVKGFDNELRNAGEGHDTYEITDNDTIILHVIDPKTGKPRGSKKIEMTYGQLENKINECRKSIWVLRNGIHIYVNNHPEIRKLLTKIRPIKVRELKEHLIDFADERWFKLTDFTVDKEKTNLSFTLNHYRKTHHVGSELLFGNGERYELITVDTKVKYADQILGVLQYIIMMTGAEQAPNISLKVYNEEQKLIADLVYSKEELAKLLKGKKAENIPLPLKGKLPTTEYSMLGDVKVPYGFKTGAIKELISKGIKVIG